jgi:iron complex outermembrane receptor protein
MTVHHHARLLLGSATMALAALATPGIAAEANGTTTTDPAPGEIIVTARRRAERVTDVPISITVADGAQLEREQVDTVADLNRIAPSLEINNAPVRKPAAAALSVADDTIRARQFAVTLTSRRPVPGTG